MEKIRIMIVDDHQMFASGVAALLEKEEDFEIIEVLTDPSILFNKISQLNPNVILMDIRMGNYNGIDLTSKIKKEFPQIKIILMSGFNISCLAKDCGADAFASKEESVSSLAHTIRKVYIDKAVVFPSESISFNLLTKTEITVLQYMSEDLTRKEIAQKMFISEKTVTNHITSILRKLNTRSRVGAIMKAVQLGLISNNMTTGTDIKQYE